MINPVSLASAQLSQAIGSFAFGINSTLIVPGVTGDEDDPQIVVGPFATHVDELFDLGTYIGLNDNSPSKLISFADFDTIRSRRILTDANDSWRSHIDLPTRENENSLYAGLEFESCELGFGFAQSARIRSRERGDPKALMGLERIAVFLHSAILLRQLEKMESPYAERLVDTIDRNGEFTPLTAYRIAQLIEAWLPVPPLTQHVARNFSTDPFWKAGEEREELSTFPNKDALSLKFLMCMESAKGRPGKRNVANAEYSSGRRDSEGKLGQSILIEQFNRFDRWGRVEPMADIIVQFMVAAATMRPESFPLGNREIRKEK